MHEFIKSVIFLLSEKLAISEDALMICFEYGHSKYGSGKEKTEAIDKLVQTLYDCIVDCLGGENENYAKRNLAWFRYYLLFSNVWLLKTIKTKGILFSLLEKVVKSQLVNQKQFIWDNVVNEKKTDEEHWNELLQFNHDKKWNNTKYSDIRQDLIENGISPVDNENAIRISAAKKSRDEAFDVMNETNVKMYLTKCLMIAHASNKEFQSKMKNLLSNYGKYQSAPVKTYDRCVVKSQTDYNDRPYPSAANIVDYLRCSCTCDTPQNLLIAVKDIVAKIESKDKLTWLPELIRIKNGFSDIKYWVRMEDTNYCDLKINCIFKNSNGICMIVEIQFLLKWLLKAKKLGHKLYNVARRKEFIDSVTKHYYDLTENKNNYNKAMHSLVIRKNWKQITTELLLYPKQVLNVQFAPSYFKKPLLYFIGQSGNSKMFGLFLSCLLYTNDIDDKNNVEMKENSTGNAVAKKYLNFEGCNDVINRVEFVCNVYIMFAIVVLFCFVKFLCVVNDNSLVLMFVEWNQEIHFIVMLH